MPKRYSIVAHFRNETMEFRGAIIMKNFKIIYFYNEEKDILWLVDLWDMRQDPHKLNLRARRIEKRIIISLYDKQKNPPGVPTDFESGRTPGGFFCLESYFTKTHPLLSNLSVPCLFHRVPLQGR